VQRQKKLMHPFCA